jgi:hypothetical protein
MTYKVWRQNMNAICERRGYKLRHMKAGYLLRDIDSGRIVVEGIPSLHEVSAWLDLEGRPEAPGSGDGSPPGNPGAGD